MLWASRALPISWRRRLTPLLGAEPDVRFDRPLVRLERVLQYWFGQWKHPRYRTAGIMHILIFAGFLILAIHTFALLGLGISANAVRSAPRTSRAYDLITNYAATVVFLCMIFAATRRSIFKPARYEVPASYGKAHTADAIFLLALIAILMFAESVFEASKTAFLAQQGHAVESLAVFSLPWLLNRALISADSADRLESLPRLLSCAGADLLLPAVLSALWNPVPRRDLALQCVLREIGQGHRQTGSVGRQR